MTIGDYEDQLFEKLITARSPDEIDDLLSEAKRVLTESSKLTPSDVQYFWRHLHERIKRRRERRKDPSDSAIDRLALYSMNVLQRLGPASSH